MPWRAREAEALLQGAEPGLPLFRQAADAALAGATGFEHNRFKIELAQRSIVRALETTSRSTA
jgi:xanthine dehydrogenase YagS FAD-binding subunit